MSRIAWNKGITKYKSKPCLCGCGEFLKVHKYPRGDKKGFSYSLNNFIKGHGKRGINGFNEKIHKPHVCLCGCGITTKKFHGRFNRFIRGHENRGRIAWNKGRLFSNASRKKMSLARLGKEPANKARIDLKKLFKLYVLNRKNISTVSQELNTPLDSVKNRLQSLGWSRSTKESCSSKTFKEQMRKIRIRALTSQKKLESPNK